MAKVKPEPRAFSRRKVPLTDEEFASLKEVGTNPMQRTTIPDEHRDRLGCGRICSRGSGPFA
jgi:hypothetical protein